MNIYFIASNCCIALQRFIRRSYKIIRLKGQHKKDENVTFPEKATQTVSTYTERHSAVLIIKEMQGRGKLATTVPIRFAKV